MQVYSVNPCKHALICGKDRQNKRPFPPAMWAPRVVPHGPPSAGASHQPAELARQRRPPCVANARSWGKGVGLPGEGCKGGALMKEVL
jgi:hypothetical protein